MQLRGHSKIYPLCTQSSDDSEEWCTQHCLYLNIFHSLGYITPQSLLIHLVVYAIDRSSYALSIAYLNLKNRQHWGKLCYILWHSDTVCNERGRGQLSSYNALMPLVDRRPSKRLQRTQHGWVGSANDCYVMCSRFNTYHMPFRHMWTLVQNNLVVLCNNLA